MTPASTYACPLCSGTTQVFGEGELLQGRRVTYVRCEQCGSVCLPEPDWLDEAYSSAITSLDVGLLERCLQLANITTAVMAAERVPAGPCLDFAGGYGTLTRLMRDRGRDFRHYDPICQNVFARGFDGTLSGRYALITAYEVLEHLRAPRQELLEVARLSDLLLVTTQVLPEPAPLPGQWDYYAPETGQHITFSSVAGLRELGASLGYRLTSTGHLVHLFHRHPLRPATRLLMRDARWAYAVGALLGEVGRRRGLTLSDSRAAASAEHRGRS
jgi:hypothetical protein